MIRIGSGSIVFHQWEIQFYFNLYREFLDSQDRLADEEFQSWKQKMAEEARQFDEDSQHDFIDYYVEERDSKQFYKVVLMNSFFVASYALYEHRRGLILSRYPMSKSEFEGSPLAKSDEWKEIERYKTIRDKIMHEGSVIPNCKEAAGYAEKRNISGDSFRDGRYALNRKFCDEALNTFEKFLLNALVELSASDKDSDVKQHWHGLAGP